MHVQRHNVLVSCLFFFALFLLLSVKCDMNSGHLITGLGALTWLDQDANIADFESSQCWCTNTHFVTVASLFAFIIHQSLIEYRIGKIFKRLFNFQTLLNAQIVSIMKKFQFPHLNQTHFQDYQLFACNLFNISWIHGSIWKKLFGEKIAKYSNIASSIIK